MTEESTQARARSRTHTHKYTHAQVYVHVCVGAGVWMWVWVLFCGANGWLYTSNYAHLYMSVLLFAYVCMLTAFETLSLLYNLVNKESESEFNVLSQETCDQNSPKYRLAQQTPTILKKKTDTHTHTHTRSQETPMRTQKHIIHMHNQM